MQSTQSRQIQWENLNESINPLNLQCGHHNLATKVCLNSNCSAYVFLCRDKSCECFKLHKGCIKGSIQSINDAIQQKLMSIEPFVKRIEGLILKAVDQLSDYCDKILVQTKKELNYIGLTQNERKFLKALDTKKADQLTGKDMHEILSSIDNVTGFNEKMEKVENKVNSCWDSFNLSMKSLFTKVQRHLQVFTGSTRLHFSDSLIIKTQTQKQRMLKFFGKQIFIPQLLYRASENDFKVTNFFEKTKGKNHTLIICQTEHGKIIGGYNHKYWRTDREDFRWGDQTKKSFVFSLTNNDKFPLKQSGSAFQYKAAYGPIFGMNGGNDFCICSQANKQKNSGGDINYAYFNGNYIKDSKQSFEMFSGSKQGFSFLVKEWQVWQINFVNPQDQ